MKWKETIRLWMKDDKKSKILVACGLCLIGLVFVGSLFPKQETKPTDPQQPMLTVEEYEQQLEQRTQELVSGIQGAGQVKVMLTLEQGTQTVYQSDTRREKSQSAENGQQNTQETVVMVEGEDGQKQALVQTEKTPAVKGVVVVCSGAGNAGVESRIVEAVTTLFSISSTQVAVVPGEASSGTRQTGRS